MNPVGGENTGRYGNDHDFARDGSLGSANCYAVAAPVDALHRCAEVNAQVLAELVNECSVAARKMKLVAVFLTLCEIQYRNRRKVTALNRFEIIFQVGGPDRRRVSAGPRFGIYCQGC